MSKIDVADFFSTIQEKHATGQATEHSYRPALEKLLKSINPALMVINEPRRVDCGSPDFVIMRDDVPVGYVEAKDVGLDIRKMKGANKNQQDRYKDGLPNLIYTNGLDFDFYRHDGEGRSQRIADVSIGDYLMGLQVKKNQFDVLENLLYEFVSQDSQAQTITSSNRLAKIMAGKAKLIRDALGKALIADKDDESDLAAQYLGFKDTLIHDITKESFADIYAETIVYGMFAARYHDSSPENFSRQEALELLPKSNPFLRKLFTFIAAHDLDEGIRWIIDDLAQIFQATRVDNIMGRWSDANDKRDPFLHFYETFLAEYNPSKRKSRGVWYTPEAVVNFIVRAVDDVLKTEFNEPLGLASTNKIPVKVKTGTKEVGRKGNKRREDVYETQQLHRVQILDPATGTGTFLAEVIQQIEPRIKAVDEGGWSNYVEHDLKPRLHGFELLMASYSMCHLKLDMMLTETGYKPPKNPKRLSVWLTNSLEEPQEDDNSLPLFGLARAINEEAKGANEVKSDKPIMCIIGNPPYSVSSSNKNPFIEKLIAPYKKNLNEKNIQPLSDDYIKFIAFSQHLIDENGEGILAFITNNSYLDGLIHRKMREELLKTFDTIQIIDLHGSTKKKETTPDGNRDENVFDIQQGVSIIIASKKYNGSKTDASNMQLFNIWGKRQHKNSILEKLKILDNDFVSLSPKAPSFGFYETNIEMQDTYYEGFKISDLFLTNQSGFVSSRDKILIRNTKASAKGILFDFQTLSIEEFSLQHGTIKDSRDWKFNDAKSDSFNASIQPTYYRPFDLRYLPYSPNSKGILSYPRHEVMRHFIKDKNIGLAFNRQIEVKRGFSDIFVSKHIFDKHGLSLKENNSIAPLYLYPDENDLDQSRRVNMDEAIRADIEKAVMGEAYTVREDNPLSVHPDASQDPSPAQSLLDDSPGDGPRIKSGVSGLDNVNRRPTEVDIFDYIYGVLHCPAYRETYAEFLKIDFPRVPYPSSPKRFWDISAKGTELRQLHLMDGVDAGLAYPYKGEGDNIVGKISKASFQMQDETLGHVLINDTQYFADVPQTAWEFYIGGYQPAQKWLKDRKGRELSFDDRLHYRKIIHILMETDRIMKTIEMDLG